MMVKCPVSSKAVRASEVITTLRPEGARSENNYLKTHTPRAVLFSDNHQEGRWRNEDCELTLLLPSDLITDTIESQARRQENY